MKKKTSLQDFYGYYRITNTSEIKEEFVFEQSGYDSENSDQILNIKISESEISEAINGLKLGVAWIRRNIK